MDNIKVGFAFCGSYCTYEQVFPALEETVARYQSVQPILSENSAATDSRFGTAAEFTAKIESITNKKVWTTISQSEPIGPQKLLDILVIAPCTGNTLAKLACGIADTSVTLAVKAHLRNARPVVIAISTNDGLGGNAANLGALLSRKHFFFVPFGQDDPFGKPTSLVADMEQLPAAIEAALEGQQLQPLLL